MTDLHKPAWGVLFLAWTTLGLLAFTRYLLLNGALPHGMLAELLGWLTCYYSWMFFTPLIFRLERRFPIAMRNAQNLVLLTLIGLLLSYFAYQMTNFMNAGVQWLLKQPAEVPNPWWSFPMREFGLEQALYWFTVAAAYVIRNYGALREKERLASELAIEKARLETSLWKAEMEALRMRLNPHFLFNCLQSIATLSQKDPKTTGQMIARLGDLLRLALKEHFEAESTLETELAFTDAYVAMEKMRFADRLALLCDVATGTEKALVPSFVLQPLVENAVKHGLKAEEKLGLISIKSSRDDGRLVLSVCDNGAGVSPRQLADMEMGVGLGSTCERLRRMYGEQHHFSIRPRPEGGTEVCMVFPLKYAESSRPGDSYEQPASIDRR